MPEEPKERARRRWPFYLGGVLAFLAAAAAIVYEPLLRKMVRERALEHGVELRCERIDYRPGSLALGGCQALLLGVDHVFVTVADVAVDLDGMDAAAARASGVDLTVVGAAPRVAESIAGWALTYPTLLSLPLEGRDVRVQWRDVARGRDAALTIATGSMQEHVRHGRLEASRFTVGEVELAPFTASWDMDLGGRSGRLSASRASLNGVDLAPVALSWSGDRATAQLTFGRAKLDRPIRIELERSDPPRVTVEIERAPLERLTAPFDVKMPIDGVSVGARAELSLGADPFGDDISGTVRATLTGYLPPHPPQLDPFIYGDGTTIESRVRVSGDRRRATLTDVSVAFGAITMVGGGNVRRNGRDADLSLALDGKLSCAQLAEIETRRRIGGALGGSVGGLVRTGVRGSVAFGVSIEASTRDLSAAKVTPVVGIGCGLKPLEQLLPDLERELKKQLPKGLPTLDGGR